jgi:hypothetical protein
LTNTTTLLIREGDLAADVTIELQEGFSDWGPTLRLPDIRKLDRVRLALLAGDVARAAQDSEVFKLVPQVQTTGPLTGAGFAEPDQSGLKS